MTYQSSQKLSLTPRLLVSAVALITAAGLLNGCASGQPDSNTAAVTESVRKENAQQKKAQTFNATITQERKKRVQKQQLMSSVAHPASKMSASQYSKSMVAQGAAPAMEMADSYVLPMPPQVDHVIALPEDRENYQILKENSVKRVSEQPVSTFSIDVDTGSYANVRRMLNQGYMPPEGAVRIEELVNYFDYNYPSPSDTETPFNVHTEVATSPWSEHHMLLQVGIQGYQPDHQQRPAANLVFLLDVSGSMNSKDKLPLLKQSLILLSKQLTKQDKVSIVVYAGASGVVLEPTEGDQTAAITSALSKLSAGGSTNGQAGIEQAYALAEQHLNKEGINRVIWATDGDFNVGMQNIDALKSLIAKKREKGIALTTLGFGQGNYNDHLMEQLADVGNGNYAYIDTLNEARKVLVDEMNSTLLTIASDVKLQMEFNPDQVAEYRLIGYENRVLAEEDFNNDKVDAGDIGAGHTVTALYELAMVTSQGKRLDERRYAVNIPAQTDNKAFSNELGFMKIRYKQPGETKSRLIEQPLLSGDHVSTFDASSKDFKFAAIVSVFGQKLKGSQYVAGVDYQTMIDYADASKGQDSFGYRSEFVQLLRMAKALDE